MSVSDFSFPSGFLGDVLAIVVMVWALLWLLMPFVIYGIYSALLRIEKLTKEMREADRIRWTRDMN